MNIKYYREQRGWSQIDLAVQSDSSKGTIGSIEAGRSHPSFNNIVKIAQALGVHPADLFLKETSKSKEETIQQLEEKLIHDIRSAINALR